MGRRLASAINPNGDNIAYTYNADGLRTSKKVIYYWNGNKLTAQTWGRKHITAYRGSKNTTGSTGGVFAVYLMLLLRL